MKKINVSAISYLNTVPFIYGLKKSAVASSIDFSYHTPAGCASMLEQDVVDVGIVPVAAVPEIKGSRIISTFCIGAVGKVGSVAIYATAPLEELTTIYLDFESRTSVLLAQLLAKKYWNIQPIFAPLSSLEEVNTQQEKAGYVLIGDKTFSYDGKFPYKYDLAEEWINFTQLPFVFAVWVANKPLDGEFIKRFDEGLNFGVNNIVKVVEKEVNGFDKPTALSYLTNNISYEFDEAKQEGLSKFWELALGVKTRVRCSY